MTSSALSASQHLTASAPTGQTRVGQTPDGTNPRLGFGGVLRSEWIKLSSLRSIRITLLLTVLGGLGVSLLSAYGFKSAMDMGLEGMPEIGHPQFLLGVATFSSSFLALIFGVLGVFAIASEYSSGMILSSLTAVPRRSPVYVAKALATAVIAGVTALLLVVAGLGIALAVLPEAGDALLDAQVVTGALGTVAYLVLMTLFAYGVAAVLRSTAGGIAVVAGATFVLPIGFEMLGMTGWAWVPEVANYLPLALGQTLAQGTVDASALPVGMPEPTGPDYWMSLVTMGAWAAAALIPAALLFKGRDAK